VITAAVNRAPRKAELFSSTLAYVADGGTHIGSVTTSTEEYALVDTGFIVCEIKKVVSKRREGADRA
jgi:hypothetical protein